MRRKFIIQKPAEDRGDFGEKTAGWDEVARRRGGFLPLGGKEIFAADGVRGEATVRIRFRYCSVTKEIKPSYRLVDARTGEVFDVIHPADPSDRGRELVLLCKELTDGV